MKKIGVLGGSFHPFHNGHYFLGQYCLDIIGLDEIWYIPTGYSYFKAGQVMLSGEERLQLVNLAIQNDKRMKALDIEIKRQGPSYTYETLTELKHLNPDYSFYLIIGADCLFEIDKWKFPDIIFRSCKVLVASREDMDFEALLNRKNFLQETYYADIEILRFPRIDISSTLIREYVAEGKSISGMVPEAVEAQILHNGYFQHIKQ